MGLLKTSHGVVETPALVTVATQAVVKTLTAEEALATGSQIAICNSSHLYLKPGEKIIKKAGGLHEFMGWHQPLMTDSGGFQIFSFGFGKDYKIGKMIITPKLSSLSFSHDRGKMIVDTVKAGHQPKGVEITEAGVYFRSPFDGREVFIGPKESIKIQEVLGADIIFAFDECTPPIADYKYTRNSMDRTHAWAKQCLKLKSLKNQALFGIVQGGKFRDLRIESAKFISALPFAGFGIGGELGFDKKAMFKMLGWVNAELPENKPRHLLGNGHLDDLVKIFQSGIDSLDCIIPTRYARHGVVFTSQGKLDLTKTHFLKDLRPIDNKCSCPTCAHYTRGYLCHLLKAKEITPLRLLTIHNLTHFNQVVASIREGIKRGKL